MAKRAMQNGIMGKIERIVGESVRDVVGNEDVVLNVLLPLTILTETVPDLNFEPPLNRSLVRILGESKNPDIAETCLDLLHYQAENGKTNVAGLLKFALQICVYKDTHLHTVEILIFMYLSKCGFKAYISSPHYYYNKI